MKLWRAIHDSLESMKDETQVLRKKSVKPRLLTITLRNARGDPVESTEGDAMSATKTLEKIQQRAREGDTMSATELLEETKTPDDQLETATA